MFCISAKTPKISQNVRPGNYPILQSKNLAPEQNPKCSNKSRFVPTKPKMFLENRICSALLPFCFSLAPMAAHLPFLPTEIFIRRRSGKKSRQKPRLTAIPPFVGTKNPLIRTFPLLSFQHPDLFDHCNFLAEEFAKMAVGSVSSGGTSFTLQAGYVAG